LIFGVFAAIVVTSIDLSLSFVNSIIIITIIITTTIIIITTIITIIIIIIIIIIIFAISGDTLSLLYTDTNALDTAFLRSLSTKDVGQAGLVC
jgi:hypothetical protein